VSMDEQSGNLADETTEIMMSETETIAHQKRGIGGSDVARGSCRPFRWPLRVWTLWGRPFTERTSTLHY